MRHLVLIRHAKSDRPPGIPDHERPLNARGRRDAVALGRWLTALMEPDPRRSIILVSSAQRTQETWSVAHTAAGGAWAAVPTVTESEVYEASPSTLRRVALRHADSADVIVLVGHNPGIGLLARELADHHQRAELADGFPTSAVAVLDTDQSWRDALAAVGALRLSSFEIPRG